MTDSAPPAARPRRVIHFVTGGFSGATQVAVDLVKATLQAPGVEPLLVLRRKRHTPQAAIDALLAQGVQVKTVSGIAHAASIWQLRQLCRQFQPDVLFAHGFPEHLIGRYGALWAGVPRLVHVEHNSRERYTRSKLAQARWLARRTERIVGVSEGVATRLRELGFPPDKVMAIPNGIELGRFSAADASSFESRANDIVMCARFSAQKDHLTAIQAMALLRDRGHAIRLLFAGGGKRRHLAAAQRLVARLDLQDQVQFLGLCSDVPALLMRSRFFLLSTHYEGMPLALIEGMAAGCAVVGSDVIGVREVIDDARNGLLVPESDPAALAEALARLLADTGYAAWLAAAARRDAQQRHGIDLMKQRYAELLDHPARA